MSKKPEAEFPTVKMDMRKFIRAESRLALTYAEDGAYHSASRVLNELALTVKVHAVTKDREIAALMGRDDPTAKRKRRK